MTPQKVGIGVDGLILYFRIQEKDPDRCGSSHGAARRATGIRSELSQSPDLANASAFRLASGSDKRMKAKNRGAFGAEIHEGPTVNSSAIYMESGRSDLQNFITAIIFSKI